MVVLTLLEAAGFLRVSRATMRRMAFEGVVPASVIRSGQRKKTYRFRQEELERWLIAQERQHAKRT